MKATGEIQVIPIGASTSVRAEVQRAHALLEKAPLDRVELHANGTNVEGDLRVILDAVERVHRTLHDEGAVRLVSYIKIATRTDKEPSLAGKMF